MDGVHFRVLDTAVASLGGLDLGLENHFLDRIVRSSEYLISGLAQYAVPKLGEAIEAAIATYSRAVANEGPYTFVVPLTKDNLSLNMTMTKAPSLSGGLIQLAFDGGFAMPEQFHQKEYDLSDITAIPERIPDSNSQ